MIAPAPTPGPPWLVLPTYDEAENLEGIVAAAREHLAIAAPGGFRVLIVDDDSPDGTGDLADALAFRHDDVRVLHRPRKAGLGRAYVAGFTLALAEGAGKVIEMDADFSHDPAVLPALIGAVDAGAQLALGSRYVPGGGIENWGVGRRILSRGGCWYAQLILRTRVHDLTGGFKCFDAAALRRLRPETARLQGYAFQIELTYRALLLGMRVVEVPIVFRERTAGTSKMDGRIALEAALRVPGLRWRVLRGRRP